MFVLSKTVKGRVMYASAMGALDDTANFELALGPLPEALVLQCKMIPRVDAAGIRTWIRYFSPNRGKEQKAKLVDVSPALLDVFQAVPDALIGVQIESIVLPFACEGCGKEWMMIEKVMELRRKKFEIPPITCPECGSSAAFDDIPEIYFASLEQRGMPG